MIEGILGLVFFGLWLIGGLFWLWMLIDCIQQESGDDRIVWLLVILLASIIGCLIYFFVRKTQRGSAAQTS